MFWRFLEGADERLPRIAERKIHLTVHIVGMELNLSGFPNDAIRVSGLSGEDGGIEKLNAVSQYSLSSPGSPPPNMILYRFWPDTCSPISTDFSPLFSIDFPCGPLFLPS
jgi:hypothetical protein